MNFLIDFKIEGEDALIVKTVREFAERYVKPRVKDLEYKGVMPKDLLEKMGEEGLLAMVISSK